MLCFYGNLSVLAAKEVNRGFDFHAGVCCACPADTPRREEMMAAGGMGVVNGYWLRIETRLLGLFWSR
jgi:hypothetical protein